MDESRLVRNFILKNFLFSEDEGALTDDGSLIASGAIDSTGVLELIMFVEQTFGISVAEEEMVPQNLDSVEKIVAYVRHKKLNKE
jgi:acyl carrier protein